MSRSTCLFQFQFIFFLLFATIVGKVFFKSQISLPVHDSYFRSISNCCFEQTLLTANIVASFLFSHALQDIFYSFSALHILQLLRHCIRMQHSRVICFLSLMTEAYKIIVPHCFAGLNAKNDTDDHLCYKLLAELY